MHQIRILAFVTSALVAVCVAWALPAHAAYPDRPIEIIVPYPPGGSTDQVARHVGQSFNKLFGQPVIIRNKPGANGQIGTAEASRAAPDGYSLLLGNTGMVMNPILYKELPYKPDRDFVPVGMVTEWPLVMVATPSLNVKTVKEFVNYIRSRQDESSFASAGLGNSTHLAGEIFKQEAGLDKIVHAPFQGDTPALTAVVGGHVQVFFDPAISVLQLVRAGKLTALGVTSRERISVLPNVPTMTEAGYPEFGKLAPWSWMGIFAPAKTPPAVLEKLRAALATTLANPEFRKTFADFGAIVFPATTTATGVEAFLNSEREKWRKIIEQAHVESK